MSMRQSTENADKHREGGLLFRLRKSNENAEETMRIWLNMFILLVDGVEPGLPRAVSSARRTFLSRGSLQPLSQAIL